MAMRTRPLPSASGVTAAAVTVKRGSHAASADASEQDVAHGLGEVVGKRHQAAGGGVHHLTGSPVLPPPGVTPWWVWVSSTTPLLESVPPLWVILPLMVVLPPAPLLPAMPA